MLSAIIFLLLCWLLKTTFTLVSQINVVQLRVTIDGIQIKEEPLIPWEKIESEKIIVIPGSKGMAQHDFVFYDKMNHIERVFRVEEFNIDEQELLKSAEIHRSRYDRRKNGE